MPYKESTPIKLYYPISEVAEMFKVNASLIRYWENEFDVLQPKKNKKGDRHFSNTDIEYIKIIFDLLKVQRLTLEGAKIYLKENKRLVKHNTKPIKSEDADIKLKLNSIRKKLIEIEESLIY